MTAGDYRATAGKNNTVCLWGLCKSQLHALVGQADATSPMRNDVTVKVLSGCCSRETVGGIRSCAFFTVPTKNRSTPYSSTYTTRRHRTIKYFIGQQQNLRATFSVTEL
jgi:hypothetical protein